MVVTVVHPTYPLGAGAEFKGEAVSRATRNLYSIGKIYIASALLYSVSAFRVKLGANDLNCVDVPLNPTHVTVVQLGTCRTESLTKQASLES